MNTRILKALLPLWLFTHGLALGLAAGDFSLGTEGPGLGSDDGFPKEASPTALAATGDGRLLFIACATAGRVAVFDIQSGAVTDWIRVPASPLGLALSKDNRRLFVVCAAPTSTLCLIDVAQRRIVGRISLGHTAMAPVLSPDEKTLYVCNRFHHSVSVVDLELCREVARIPVLREPVAADITPDGKLLVVANHLHNGTANDKHAQAAVSLIETATRRVVRKVPLTLGSSLLRGVAVSPDGRFAAVTHLRALFWLPTSHIDLGRINCNALTILDLRRMRALGTLLLDQAVSGAANPWAAAWTPDGQTIAVTHAGTHELSLIDAPRNDDSWNFQSMTLGYYSQFAGRSPAPPKNPVRIRKRIPLPGLGPRALTIVGSDVYVANYFSDDLCRIDLSAAEPAAELVSLGITPDPSIIRQGELLFNDARICAQGWQSCASCHDADARTDALNWDLLNDGIGNPKNTKSLVWAHQTAPVMALGVRASAEVAVRAGVHHILFTDQPEEVVAALDAYLRSVTVLPSPHLENGQLSPAAERGQKLFHSAGTRCAECHPPPLFTDLTAYDVGTATAYKSMWGITGQDKESDRFDTPQLAELWRTAPYLHDGSATTLREVLTTRNGQDRHGRTSHLTSQEIDDLVEYLLSL